MSLNLATERAGFIGGCLLISTKAQRTFPSAWGPGRTAAMLQPGQAWTSRGGQRVVCRASESKRHGSKSHEKGPPPGSGLAQSGSMANDLEGANQHGRAGCAHGHLLAPLGDEGLPLVTTRSLSGATTPPSTALQKRTGGLAGSNAGTGTGTGTESRPQAQGHRFVQISPLAEAVPANSHSPPSAPRFGAQRS